MKMKDIDMIIYWLVALPVILICSIIILVIIILY